MSNKDQQLIEYIKELRELCQDAVDQVSDCYEAHRILDGNPSDSFSYYYKKSLPDRIKKLDARTAELDREWISILENKDE